MASEDAYDMTTGEIARTLKRLADDQAQLVKAQRADHGAVMTEISSLGDKFIHRAEWDMQNRIFAGDIAELKIDVTDGQAERANLKSHLDRFKGWASAAGAFLGIALGILYAYM